MEGEAGAAAGAEDAVPDLRAQLAQRVVGQPLQTGDALQVSDKKLVPVARLAEFVETAGARLAALAPGARIVGYGHVGDGNLHFNLSPPAGVRRDSAEERAFVALAPRVNRAIHDLVAALGGSFSAEHGIGRLKTGELERYEDPVALAVMRAVKTALDPDGIMNPGKVLARPSGDRRAEGTA